MFKYVCAIFVVASLFCGVSYAQFGDIPTDERYVDVGFTADTRDKNLDITSVVPFYNGYAGVIVSQGTQEGVLDSQTIVARVQNGFRYHGLGFEGFVDSEWDQVKGTNTHEVGGFIRPGIKTLAGVTLSGGLGTYVENQAVRADLGLTDKDPETLPRLLGFVSAKYNGIPNTSLTTLFKYAPAYSFDESKYSVDGTIQYDLSDAVSLVKIIHWERDTDPIVESAGSHYQASLNIRVQY